MRLTLMLLAFPFAAFGAVPDGIRFASIDGGEIALQDWRGKPVLVVNTASLCGFSEQFDDLQDLADSYDDLVVLAVPSNDFKQELATGAEVAEYCAMNFDLTIPMTDITTVTGSDAHPFYAWLKQEHGFAPTWNFNKVLIDAEGELVDTWGAGTVPTGPEITGRIAALMK